MTETAVSNRLPMLKVTFQQNCRNSIKLQYSPSNPTENRQGVMSNFCAGNVKSMEHSEKEIITQSGLFEDEIEPEALQSSA